MYYNYDENRENTGQSDPGAKTSEAAREPDVTVTPEQITNTVPESAHHEETRAPEPNTVPDLANTVQETLPKEAGAAEEFKTEAIYRQAPETQEQRAWSEPSYSQAQENEPGMYTPGLNSRQFYSSYKAEDTEKPRRERRESGRLGGFVKAVCLVLACVLLSGAATYGVMEYRIRNGDFTTVNQVTLGGSRPNNELTTPMASSAQEMIGQDIYDMACTQVVGLKTEVPNSGFFGQQSSMTAVSGSGFIISDDGYILTNYHVIESAYRGGYPLKAVLHDGTEYSAKIIGFEESNDVAVIKIEASGLNAVVVGDSDGIRVGQRVYAVGNPFGELVYTMTEGIISGLNRVVSVDNKSIGTFQLSAAVNSGNSGGPVYNDKGEVIGIVTAKFMSSSVEGIGFAIPINDAIGLALDLVENGYITGKAYMGISVRTFSQAYAEFFSSVEGAYVVTVTEGSAADKAGIKVGDIITKLGETEVTSEDSLLYAKNKFKAGDTTTLSVRRSGEDYELTITFDEDTTWAQQQAGSSESARQPQDSTQQPVYPMPEITQIP